MADPVRLSAANYNRYVDGLGAITPPERADYADIGQLIVPAPESENTG